MGRAFIYGREREVKYKEILCLCRVLGHDVVVKAVVSPMSPGKVHDKKVYDRARVLVPPGVRATGDTSYQGTALLPPVKCKRGQRQRRGNARISRRRIAVEHAIGKLKIWRVASERYRNPIRRHTLIVKNVAGLHNLMFS